MKLLTLKHAKNLKAVPSIMFGAMGISESYGTTNQDAVEATLQAALREGITLIDTADVYGHGENEKFLNRVLSLSDSNQRKQVMIASKSGIVRDKKNPALRAVDISPEYIEKQLDNILERLGIDYLDIYYIHRMPKNVSDQALKACMETLKKLKESGKIRAIGLSEISADILERAHQYCPVSILQTEYSLLRRGPETDGVLETCRKLGILFAAYSPLCRGALSGSFDLSALEPNDLRNHLPIFSKENWEHNNAIIQKLAQFAKEKGCTLAQLSLAWLAKQNVAMVVGMRSPTRVIDNIASLKINLTDEDLANIDKIAPVAALKGTRYPAEKMEVYGMTKDMPKAQ